MITEAYRKYKEKVNKRCLTCNLLIDRRATYCKRHRPFSAEWRRKLGDVTRGKKFSEEHKRKISESSKGDRAGGWRGGVSTLNHIARSSREYKEWRRKVFKRDDRKCVACGSRKHIEADHIYPFSVYPQLRFKVGNGRTLCRACHEKTDTYMKPYKQLTEIVKLPDRWECEICSCEFAEPLAVRNEMLILNGTDSRCFAYVCDPCITKVVEALDITFPQNKYAERARQAAAVKTN